MKACRLGKQEKQIYKSLNGNIIVSCNGSNTSVSCSNNNTILKDSEWFNEKIYVVVSEKGIKQICSGTKKFFLTFLLGFLYVDKAKKLQDSVSFLNVKI